MLTPSLSFSSITKMFSVLQSKNNRINQQEVFCMEIESFIHSGYTGIFNPKNGHIPKGYTSNIYCIGNQFNDILFIMPLTYDFYKDVASIVDNYHSHKIFLIANDPGIVNISAYYLAWYYIKKTMRLECKIICWSLPKEYLQLIPVEFYEDFILGEGFSIDVARADLETGTINISFTKNYMQAGSIYVTDVLISDTYTKKLFVSEMNLNKAMYLLKTPDFYDEIHMPYIEGMYGGISYNDTIRVCPNLATCTICNNFGSLTELQYAQSLNISIGKEFYL